MPAGFVFGLPVGLSFFGRRLERAALIRLAYAFEQATQPPKAAAVSAYRRSASRLANGERLRVTGAPEEREAAGERETPRQ